MNNKNKDLVEIDLFFMIAKQHKYHDKKTDQDNDFVFWLSLKSPKVTLAASP